MTDAHQHDYDSIDRIIWRIDENGQYRYPANEFQESITESIIKTVLKNDVTEFGRTLVHYTSAIRTQ